MNAYSEIKINNIIYHLYGIEGGRNRFPFFYTAYENARKENKTIFELFDNIYNILKIREFPWYTEYCVARYRKDDCYIDTDGWFIPARIAAFKGIEIAVVWECKK